jgi:hypothetical protein
MPQQSWESLVNTGAPWQTASGTPLATAATLTLSPEGAGGTGNDPQIYPFYQGQVIRVQARGVYTVGSTATTFAWILAASATGTALPGTGAGVLATTGALNLPVSVTSLWWKLEALIQVRAMAQGTSTATLYTHGEVQIQTATPSGTTANVQVWPMPATAGPTAADIDTTIAHTFGLVGTLSQVTGSPTVTCTQFTLETIN